MRKIFYLVLVVAGLSACTKPFKKGDGGLEYKIIPDGKGEKIKYGNYMQIHIGQYYNNGKTDSMISDSRTLIPAYEILDSVRTPMNYFKILSQLRKGDSLVIRTLSDSLFKKNIEAMPPFMKKGHLLITTVKMLNIFETKAQADSSRQKDIEFAEARQKVKDKEQIGVDDKILIDYFKKNNISTVKTPGGTYVETLNKGTGPGIDTTVIVKVNYTGKILNGKAFDSNTDPAFKHVQPYYVNMTNDNTLGGSIPGLKEGITNANKGTKLRLYIPSAQGYGSQGSEPVLKPNSILVFDIDILDVLSKEVGGNIIREEIKKMQEQQQMQQQMQQMQQQMQQQQPPAQP